MDIASAVISGIAGTIVISIVMGVAPMMGFPKMDIVDLLSKMFGKPNKVLGWMMHFMMGIVFALIYSFLWSIEIGAANWLFGLIFGAVHWLVIGVMMVMIPVLHAGIKSGDVEAPGLWMTNQGGMLAFVGGLMGHMVFGLVVALVYNLI